MRNIFITRANPYGYQVGSTINVADAIANANDGQWCVLSERRILTLKSPTSLEILGGTWTPLSANYTLSAADDGMSYYCTAPLTVTVPLGLIPRPTVVFQPPPTGNLSMVGVLNGTQQTLTRTRAANAGGVGLIPYFDVDSYGFPGN